MNRLALHEFVIMPNHVHLLITPAPTVSLEKAMQFIKGGFSFRAGRELGFRGVIWQKGFNEHRIRDACDYTEHVKYIHMNPVKAGLMDNPAAWPYGSARLTQVVDPSPAHLKKASAKAPIL